MKHLIFLLIIIAPAICVADTTWVSPGPVQGVWTAENSPYMILGNVQIDGGTVLEVGPGVECNFTESFRLTVHGEIIATGTESDSIWFTRSPGDSAHGWQGIWSETHDTIRFHYCVFERMIDRDWCPFYLEDSSSMIATHCTFRNNGYRTLMADWASHIELSHCDFVHNGFAESHLDGGALYLQSVSSANVTGCLFAYNTSGSNLGGAIKANGGSELHLSRCVIKNNTSANGGGAIWAYRVIITAENCTFIGNYSQVGSHIAIQTNDDTTQTRLLLNSCVFANSRGTGGALSINSPLHPEIRNCAFFANTPLFQQPGRGRPGFRVINFLNLNGDSCDVYANLFLDPLFADTSAEWPGLLAGSPCIDAGDSTLPYDPDSSVADIGAVYFQQSFPWHTVRFENGFNGLGCPCESPMGLVQGSIVSLKYDLTHDGGSPDDPLISEFAVSAGAGLPPWNGEWTPRPDSVLRRAAFYVEVSAGVCCWRSDSLWIDGSGIAHVDAVDWRCANSCAALDSGISTGAAQISLPRDTGQHDVKLSIAPNPFNVQTRIQYSIPVAGMIEMALYDIQGRKVSDLIHGSLESGNHSISWSGADFASGIYFVRLQIGANVITQKLLLLK